jgi:hypothetical protein
MARTLSIAVASTAVNEEAVGAEDVTTEDAPIVLRPPSRHKDLDAVLLLHNSLFPMII